MSARCALSMAAASRAADAEHPAVARELGLEVIELVAQLAALRCRAVVVGVVGHGWTM